MVMVVANICWHHEDSLKIGRTYELDDGTGRIRGRYLDPTYNLVYEPFAYVRVTGQLEDSRGSRMLKITNIQLIFDAHEIYYHILHSIFDTLVDERGPPPPGTFPSPFNEHDAPSGVEHFSTLKVSNHSTSEPSSSAMDPQILNLMESGSRSQRLPLLQLDALVCIQDPQMPSGEYGVFIGDIIERLKEKYSDLTGPEMWQWNY
ncbi:hypothetical protein CPC08DRAFT_371953 [Agrocybe pediades]|nr:hypothetical protein CPC08DRAFT_371953 [Agrocybe pediades]